MELDIMRLLRERPEMLLFCTIGLGYLVGKIGAFGIKLGATIGVLLCALFFGHLGFELHPLVGTVGFIFFIYSVGYQSGPRFFDSFRRDGLRYVQVGLVIAFVAVTTALLAGWALRLEPGYAAGVLAGGLTSTPTLAAAQDAVRSGLATIPDGYTAAEVEANIAVGYAVTYIFGLVGLILSLQILPKLLRADLAKESKEIERSIQADGKDQDDELGLGAQGMPSSRVYEATREEAIGKTLRELRFLETTGAVVSQMRRAEEALEVGPDTPIAKGDRLLVVGYRQSQIKATRLVGREVEDPDLEQIPFETRKVLVTDRDVSGQTLRELGITHRFACISNRISRGGVDLPVTMKTRIQAGDYLVISGPKQNLDEVTLLLGRTATPIHETDLLTFAIGIAVGLLVGFSTIKIGQLPISIGSAGGLLAAGLVVGWARVRHPLFGRVPRPARYILMELGLLLFLTAIGVRAGSQLVEGVRSAGFRLFAAGACVTLLPLLAGILYGKFVLKLNPAILFGSVCGGLTSTPALGVITKQADSNVPAIGYAGVYAFSNIVLTLAGQLVMLV